MSVLRLNTLGTRWEVDLSRMPEPVAENLRRLWRDAGDWTPDRSEPAGFPRRLAAFPQGSAEGVVEGAERIFLPSDGDSAPYAFSGELTRRAIAAQAGRLTMLHAAALALPETGATLLLVAPSGTGKTTAATRLGRELNYLTDETAAVRDDLSIVPHPKPLSIVGQGGKHERSPADLGLLPPRPDAWVAGLVILERAPGAPARLERVGVIDAIIDVIPQSSSLPAQAAPFGTLMAVLSAGRGVSKLMYGEIDDAVPIVLDLLRSAHRGAAVDLGVDRLAPPPDRAGQPWLGHHGTEDLDLSPAGLVRRAPWVDALREEDEVLVLNGPLPVRLLGLGSTIWLSAADPVSLAELTAVIVDTHGEHPESDRLIAEAVRALAGQGLLVAAD
jgi:hypothetical protein